MADQPSNPNDDFTDDNTGTFRRDQIEAEKERLRKAVEDHLMRRSSVERARDLLQRTAKLTLPPDLQAQINEAPIGSAYRALPRDAAANPEKYIATWWRVELHPSGSTLPLLGLDLYADVTIGRGNDPGLGVDLDLEPYGAMKHGISRQHAILRPTHDSLLLMDLGSTNGTRCNGIRLATDVVQSLAHNDIITFGNLVFQIKIVRTPGGPYKTDSIPNWRSPFSR